MENKRKTFLLWSTCLGCPIETIRAGHSTAQRLESSWNQCRAQHMNCTGGDCGSGHPGSHGTPQTGSNGPWRETE